MKKIKVCFLINNGSLITIGIRRPRYSKNKNVEVGMLIYAMDNGDIEARKRRPCGERMYQIIGTVLEVDNDKGTALTKLSIS